MSALLNYYQKTKQLIETFSNMKDDEWELKMEQSEAVFLERDKLLQQIAPPFSDEDQVLFEKIQQLEKALESHMKNEKLSIHKNIKRLTETKESSNKYNNPYEHMNTDGMFYDKRN
ncbi:flagellar protein FliT [Cytobacillus sp. FJAT-53684]|uniref:Flagellar protein FliT n=1 Tax=Cytobacillus mangrovibacter TaxID=3299024 RepID=A0ABW6K0Q7_9BACI